eukprot:NODE_972_length_2821_cov_1.084864.p3 type:complete len:189 gc:universal NODE_972_length_2821_cov_1.084864:858-292(-)
MDIVLASSSSSRKAILARHMTFTTISPDIDEKAIRYTDPYQLTLEIAKAKMKAVQDKCRDKIVICLDQVVVVNGIILEKPADQKEARNFLEGYNKYPAVCISGLVTRNTTTRAQKECNVVATQRFKTPIPDKILEELSYCPDLLYCAGALMVEHPLLQDYIIPNDYEEAIQGLPIKEVKEHLIGLQLK